MRKLTVLFIILLSTAGVVQAQKGVVVRKGVGAVTKSSGRGSAGAMVKTPKGPRNLPVTGRARAGSVVAPAQGNPQSRALTKPTTARTDATTLVQQAHTGVAMGGVLSSKESQAAILDKAKQQAEQVEKLVIALEKRAELQQQKWNNFFETGIGKSVLFAPVGFSSAEDRAGFSMTVIKTEYAGQKEIFGVIPSHALPDRSHNRIWTPGLLSGKEIKIELKDAYGRYELYDAEVVQFAPSSLLDISLVKLSPEAEELVSPLEIAEEGAQNKEALFSIGFKNGQPDKEERVVQRLSLFSVRTDQNLEGDRAGFCGSPLIDGNNQVKAIHTGTKEIKDGPDVSYGTHAKYINLLVEGYHNNGQALYDLVIDNQVMAKLNVDEYISAYAIYNSEGKLVAQKSITEGLGKEEAGKFSEVELRQLLQTSPDANYLLLRTRSARWNEYGGTVQEVRIRKNPKSSKTIDPTKRENWYNLQTKQIEPTRPSVIKM